MFYLRGGVDFRPGESDDWTAENGSRLPYVGHPQLSENHQNEYSFNYLQLLITTTHS